MKRAFASFSRAITRRNSFAAFRIRCVPSRQNAHSRKIYGKSLDLRQTAQRNTVMLVGNAKKIAERARRKDAAIIVVKYENFHV